MSGLDPIAATPAPDSLATTGKRSASAQDVSSDTVLFTRLFTSCLFTYKLGGKQQLTLALESLHAAVAHDVDRVRLIFYIFFFLCENNTFM